MDITHSKCEECMHSKVCKIKDAYMNVISIVDGATKDLDNSFKLTISCNEFFEQVVCKVLQK